MAYRDIEHLDTPYDELRVIVVTFYKFFMFVLGKFRAHFARCKFFYYFLLLKPDNVVLLQLFENIFSISRFHNLITPLAVICSIIFALLFKMAYKIVNFG